MPETSRRALPSPPSGPRSASLVLLFAALSLSSCTQGSPDIGRADLRASLQVGSTDRAQVRRLYGEPQQQIRFDDGRTEWEYEYSEPPCNSLVILPFVGLLMPRTTAAEVVVVTFDGEGALRGIGAGQRRVARGPG